jgi:cytochrome c5
MGCRSLACLLVFGAALGCSSAPSSPGVEQPNGLAYLESASVRRDALVRSLVNPDNGYSTTRLAHYATGGAGDWDALPEWNPAAETIEVSELDQAGGASTTSLSTRSAPLSLPTSVASADDPALLALGKAAFERYPTQLAPYFSVALTSPAAAARYGLWTDAARGVAGLVRARMADGSGALAMTCSTCHASPDSRGNIAPGLPNHSLDIGDAIVSAATVAAPPHAIASWGPGRVDVTTSEGTEPARIPDLRPVRWLSYLQQDATLRGGDLTTLAIRIETLIITSNDDVLRPPRIIALALAAYVMSLADALPAANVALALSPDGAAVFSSECAMCHAFPGLTGAPVALPLIGTDPTLGLSSSRGTGTYRVPSLHGVGSRGPLLHDGTIPSIDALLDPTRLTSEFTDRLHGPGSVPGHRYGLDLSAEDRAALIGYLQAL